MNRGGREGLREGKGKLFLREGGVEKIDASFGWEERGVGEEGGEKRR